MNSTVDVEGGFNLRHRIVGALVLVLLGIVVLPIILNGASMTEQVVEIGNSDGEKQPRTFETNIRPLNSDDSEVKVDSESEDRLEARLSFPKPDAPDVVAENAPSPGDNASAADTGSVPDQSPVSDESGGSTTTVVAINDGDSGASATPDINADDASPSSTTAPQPQPGDNEVARVESDSAEIVPLPEVDPNRALEALNKDGKEDGDTNRVADDAKPVDLNASPVDHKSQAKAPSEADKTVEAQDQQAQDDEAGTEASKDAVQEASSGEQKTQPEKVSTAAGWVVRVGTFGEASNAARMVELLKSKGFEGQSSIGKTKSGKTLTRVWVGPFKDRAAASQRLSKIEQTTGEKGFITAYP